jgi:hypothetical protein
MKKRLESELISIAHRVLKLKNKSDVDQLYHETQKLYETLSVLKFYHENFEQLKLQVSQEELEQKIENSLVEKPSEEMATPEIAAKIPAQEVVEEAEVSEEKLEEKIDEMTTEDESEVVSEEEIEAAEEPIIVGEIAIEDEDEEEIPALEAKDDLDFEPIFELASEEKDSETKLEVSSEAETEKVEEKPESKSKTQQISFEDLLGHNYSEPVFVKPNDITPSIPKKETEEVTFKPVQEEEIIVEKTEPKISTLNEKFAAGINVGLNDRIAFVKNLFGNSDEDYNRVISQLNTFDTLQEAQEFIEDMVKPDYNDWNGKEEYAERFMEIVEKKFA